MHRRTFGICLAGLVLTGAATPLQAPSKPSRPIRPAGANAQYPEGTAVFFGCQPGGRTLDGSVSSPGNPFATAFIATLKEPGLDFRRFAERLYDRTKEESRQFQLVDTPPKLEPASLALSPVPKTGTAVALVLVVSRYRMDRQLPTLAGARYDARRVAEALAAAGYRTSTVLDTDRASIEEQLDAFAEESESADIALIYTTGHGLEVGGIPYILMQDFDMDDGPDGLRHRALPVSVIAAAARARAANVVLSAACRDNPAGW